MINQSKLGVNKELSPLMDIQCHWYAKVDRCIYNYKVSQQTKIYKITLLFILQVHMNGIHLFWIMNILKTMDNLIRQLIPTKTFNLTQILMNLVTMSIDHCPFLTYQMKNPKLHQFIIYWLICMSFNEHQLIMKS